MSLLILDLDGLLRKPTIVSQYVPLPQDQLMVEGADRALYAYRDDWLIVGITNQNSVAAGYKSIQQCIQDQQSILKQIPQLQEIYVCPDFEGRKCLRVTRQHFYNHSQTRWFRQYRKPQPGMLKLAMVRHNHWPENCLYVGDRPEDKQAAYRADVPFQWTWEWIARHRFEAALR
ncbi:MAG TPA: HAD-IIIA family hydrolase [Crinalium sp.]|jgi:D-glycero-D-manno-heptose 1,7-bisphosphate phosphatase